MLVSLSYIFALTDWALCCIICYCIYCWFSEFREPLLTGGLRFMFRGTCSDLPDRAWFSCRGFAWWS